MWLLIILVLVGTAAAGERTLTIDPKTSEVTFTLGATMHKVHGSVGVATGEIRFSEVPGAATGEIVLDATSAETGNKKRDRKMHKEVLESAAHPVITLVPTRIDGALPVEGQGTLTLHGRLTLHGGDHDVQLPVEVTVSGDSVRASATLRVPYVQWGLDDPSAFVLRVDKHVDVTIETSGTVSEDETETEDEPEPQP
jgi:polyisoprenoid-binding protein YceI